MRLTVSELQLPAVGEDVQLSDAYETLKASGKSGLVVMHADGPRLFRAESLELQLPNRAGEAMKNIAGGTWLPEHPHNAEWAGGHTGVFLVKLVADSAILGGLSPEMSRDLCLGVRIYCCSLYPTVHTYTGTQYRALPVVNGVRYCSTRDGGVVS